MANKCKCDCPTCMPEWLAAFGDLMSLLLCFFVLLLSMATMDAKKVQAAVGSLAGALSVLEGGTKTEISREMQQKATPIESTDETAKSVKTLSKTIGEINEMIKTQGGPEVTLDEAEDGFVLRLPSALLFGPGSALIENDDAVLFLKRISQIIQKLPKELQINAIGHTDDSPPIATSQFRDNWELSSARAVSVAKELMKNSIEPKRITASGKAEFTPLASNTTQEGREKNRRVELYFFSTDKKSKDNARKSVLDSATATPQQHSQTGGS